MTQHTYTDVELATIVERALAGDYVAAIVKAYRPFGVDLTSDDQEPVKPWTFAIPEVQWRAIADAILEGEASGALGRVNGHLDWMNHGPTTIESQEAS